MKSFQTEASVHILNGIYSMRRDCDAWCEIKCSKTVKWIQNFHHSILHRCIAFT